MSSTFSPEIYQVLSLDLPALFTTMFAAVTCALLGNFLVLRKVSLMGDAISHAVLPGIVVAFLLTESRESWWMFIGASLAGLLASVLIEAVRRFGKMESGAAMGVVFSLFFAFGVLLIEQAAARSVDLDADCLLHGQLESIFWFPPNTLLELLRLQTLFMLPTELWISFSVMLVTGFLVFILFKELTLSAFDPDLGSALGYSSSLMHFGLMVVVAAAVVAAFSAVGSILVIAMLICPAATSRLLTDRLKVQLLLSVLFALAASVLGYLLGAFLPPFFGWPNSVSISGSMTVVLGVFLTGTVLLSPRYGVLGKKLRNRRLSLQILGEDILGFLFREEESEASSKELSVSLSELPQVLAANPLCNKALGRLEHLGLLYREGTRISMTHEGRKSANQLVRSHRLWEHYFAEKLGLAKDHIHKSASKLEHFTGEALAEKLASEQDQPRTDPHGMPIPVTSDND